MPAIQDIFMLILINQCGSVSQVWGLVAPGVWEVGVQIPVVVLERVEAQTFV